MTIEVGSDRYYGLHAKEQFEYAHAALVDADSRASKDVRRIQSLTQEVYALRVAISCGDAEMGVDADPLWDITHNTMIHDPSGAKVVFVPSPSQMEDLLQVFDDDRRDGIPGRYWLTKVRRVRGSSAIAQWMRTRVCRQHGKNALVAVHDKETAKIMFRDLYKFPWSQDPLHPTADYDTKQELFFKEQNGLIRVVTVKANEGIGASTGMHYIHLSEFLRYEENGVDFEDLYNNLIMTMPQPPAETFFIGESTGRGDGGVAYGFVQHAYQNAANWKPGDFRVIFLPSYKRVDAQKEFESVSERADLMASLEEDERHIVETLKVPLEHVNWRRWFEHSQIKARTAKQRRSMMRQEAPITFQDCFQARGVTEFDSERLRELSLKIEGGKDPVLFGPIWQGDLRTDAALYDPRTFRFVVATPMPRFVEVDDGDLFVWEKPTKTAALVLHRYCMGVDISEGGEDGNYSVAWVIDRDTKNLVAVLRCKARHDELLKHVRLLSKWYNDARIANEVNRFRKWTEDLASTDRASLMYRRRGQRDTIDQDDPNALGWLTTPTSKDAIVDAWHSILENTPQWCRWEHGLSELRTFKREAKHKQRGPRKGVYDDCVMAGGIAYFCDRDEPKPGVSPLPTAEPPGPPRTKLAKEWDQWKAEQKKLKATANSAPSQQKIFEGQI